MGNERTICGKVKQPDAAVSKHSRKIGGPRYVCMKPIHHEGACGDWEWMTDAEHGDYLFGRKHKDKET